MTRTEGAHARRHGDGALRRRHIVTVPDARTVVAGMEDEMHRFELVLRHDDQVVTAIEGTPVRWPWSPCLDSPAALHAVEGMPLTTAPAAIGRFTDARQQCTHQFDLAGLAVAHAARTARGGEPVRQYDAVVPDWVDPPYTASLQRDGVDVLSWTLGADAITAPEPFAGLPLRGRFIEWCEANLDDDLAEAAMLLRRAVWISPARRIDLEGCATANDSALREGVCFTAQPHRIAIAVRNRGSLRDYGHTPDALLSDFPRARS
ncbi:MAG TPA: hypothetical protein VGQ20_02865 [Acidimicrobiales bacterium]|jgi:hypothetical protein|nr:hypothetical protein [Acidimicrobiales bacterium]